MMKRENPEAILRSMMQRSNVLIFQNLRTMLMKSLFSLFDEKNKVIIFCYKINDFIVQIVQKRDVISVRYPVMKEITQKTGTELVSFLKKKIQTRLEMSVNCY